jgi:serine/threonine protein kinase
MECIGQGAFGAVNSGQDLKTKNMVAIKTVNKI